ncbi:MAG: GntR family transcriptional regulator [Pseudomonadota bacterium]
MPSAKETCLDTLRARILALTIAPGSDLDEAGLSAEFGLSRTPLREVLQRLAGEGYVTQTANRGAKVASMDLPTMRVFFQTAPMIYASVARLAAEQGTRAQIDDLKDAQARFTRATAAGDAHAAALSNHRFHAIIGDMAHNPYLAVALGRMLIDHTRLSQTFYRPTSPEEATRVTTARDQHDAMIAAFEARTPEAAIDITLAHWELSRDRMEQFVRPDPLPIDPVGTPVATLSPA